MPHLLAFLRLLVSVFALLSVFTERILVLSLKKLFEGVFLRKVGRLFVISYLFFQAPFQNLVVVIMVFSCSVRIISFNLYFLLIVN